MKVLLIFSAVVALCYGRVGFGPGEQDWGYVTVRPEAHMFWWLYETTANVANITEKPLVIWLQGGPGASSSGFGNFAEIGPLDVDLNTRNHTWVKDVNVLFIDNPVGTGFSYTETKQALTTTNKQIAEDLLTCILGFYKKHPQFRHVPLYVASESYGGKMAAEFAVEVDQFNKNGNEIIKLLGISLIDSWISPIESVHNWAPFLYNVGAVDSDGRKAIEASANLTQKALDRGEFVLATNLWAETEYVIMRVAHNVDFYNILKKIKSRGLSGRSLVLPGGEADELSEDEKLDELMNVQVKEALNLNVTFGAQSSAVFTAQKGDFMKPVTSIVEDLLNNTNIKVQIVTGQLDLIVDTAGTTQWVEKLRWTNSAQWKKADRKALVANGINEGYQKKYGAFSVYWVNRAGHMVPADNPDAMDVILKDLLRK